MTPFKNNLKGNKGQAATVLNLIIAIFVVGVIGVFAFELTRYFLAHDELKTNVEVAALSCQTTLASSGDPTNSTNQAAAEATALQLFRQNSILGQPMSGATSASYPSALEPAPGNAQICFQFLDPLTRSPIRSLRPIVLGAGSSPTVIDPSSAGTLVQVIGSYSYAPVFGQFIGLSGTQFTFQVSALSGVPKIDLMIVLDISGGMDDDTSVSFYQRYEGPSGTNWMITPNPVAGGTAQGQLYSVWCPEQPGNPMVGANALPPYEYEKIDGSSCVTVHYSEGSLGGSSQQLAGAGVGTPPGNACTTNSSSSTTSTSMLPAHFGYGHIAKKRQKAPHSNKLKIAGTKHDRLISRNVFEKRWGAISKTVTNQLNDKFSKICFNPYFSINQGVYTHPYIVVSPYPINYLYDPGTNPPIASTYTASDGMQYLPLSVAPGGQADSGPPVLPGIAGIGCSGGTSTINVGAPAQSVFTGLFVNGVVGASSTANPSMNFNNAATAIEASLGNLESAQAAQQAGVDVSQNGLNVTPQAGWYALYYAAARAFMQPMMACLTSLISFINEMAVISDIHYGLITFNDSVGVNANSVSNPVNNFSANYNYNTFSTANSNPTISTTYPIPNILLDPNNSNQSLIIAALPTLSVWGGRNVTQALQAAASRLQQNGRPGANKAIILITSGPPNGSDTSAAAIAQASTIGQSGIPVFVVCASVASTYDSANDDAYTDLGGSGGGVAGASGHGAKYYRVDYTDPTTTKNQLVSAFGNIARRLVSIVSVQQ